MKKIHIGIIFGGSSTEHDVSIQSTAYILEKIDKKKFKIFLINIDKSGTWSLCYNFKSLLKEKITICILKKLSKKKIFLDISSKKNKFYQINKILKYLKIDIFFPLLHGGLGENGALQGFFRIFNLPFVGSDVMSSAISMNKEITKRLLHHHHFNIAPFISLKKLDNKFSFNDIVNKFGVPFFIKPISHGSSIGVSKVYDAKGYKTALELAFSYDNKILIEKSILGKEIECAILGNNHPISSVCGEIITKKNFYNYESKYLSSLNTKIIIPARISNLMSKKIRSLSIKVFKILECHDMARIDVFLTLDNKIIINEINTLPGFTEKSMYPMLWKHNNKFDVSNLITKLIQLAIKRYTSKYIKKI